MSLLAGKCLKVIQAGMRGNDQSSVAIVTWRWGLRPYEYFYIPVESSSFFFLVRHSLVEFLYKCTKQVKVMSLPFLFGNAATVNYVSKHIPEAAICKKKVVIPPIFMHRMGYLKNNIKCPVRHQTCYSSRYANPFCSRWYIYSWL